MVYRSYLSKVVEVYAKRIFLCILMLFTAFVFCSLGLVELKTEGQRI